MASNDNDYFAYVPVGVGGSFFWANDPEIAARKCAKVARADWGGLYDLKDPFTVHVWDATGWHEDSNVHMYGGQIEVVGGGTSLKPAPFAEYEV